MECRVARNMLSQYIDDELPHEQKETVDLHLKGCEACGKEFKELLAVHKLFMSAERFSAPYGFSTRVMANLEEEKEGLWGRFLARPIFLKAIEVAFALIIVIIGFISGNVLTAHKPSLLTPAEVRRSFALYVFEAVPPNSMGSIYASMTGARNEE